jgi:hypothetical protein
VNHEPPSHIHQKHWDEWLDGSAIDPKMTALNLISVSGQASYERLFYSEQIKRLNTAGFRAGFSRNTPTSSKGDGG